MSHAWFISYGLSSNGPVCDGGMALCTRLRDASLQQGGGGCWRAGATGCRLEMDGPPLCVDGESSHTCIMHMTDYYYYLEVLFLGIILSLALTIQLTH